MVFGKINYQCRGNRLLPEVLKTLNANNKTLKHSEENMGKYLYAIRIGKDILKCDQIHPKLKGRG